MTNDTHISAPQGNVFTAGIDPRILRIQYQEAVRQANINAGCPAMRGYLTTPGALSPPRTSHARAGPLRRTFRAPIDMGDTRRQLWPDSDDESGDESDNNSDVVGMEVD